MKRVQFLVLTGLVVTSAVLAQPSGMQAPIANSPKVELKGRIEKIQLARGQGMPYLEVRTTDKPVRVVLGSMRYLMEQDFNPKAGDEVAVTGYKLNDSIVAITVTTPATGKVLRLRDEAGRPVWMGGRRGQGMHRPSR
jgi:hypothetical protein